jgi:hypothetical protein
MSPEPSDRSPREDHTRPDPLHIDDLKLRDTIEKQSPLTATPTTSKDWSTGCPALVAIDPTGADGQQHQDFDIWNHRKEEATELILHEESTTKALSTPVATTCWKSTMI